MAESGVEAGCLDFVFIPKDAEGTKARIKAFKEYTDNVKKTTFEKNINSRVPGAGSGEGKDADLRQAFGL